MEISEKIVNLICYKWKDLFESINMNSKLYLRKVVSPVSWRFPRRKIRVFILFCLKGTFRDSFKSFHTRIPKIFVHRRTFCKPDKTLNTGRWLIGCQRFQSMWLSQEHFSPRSGFITFHLQHHFITTQTARNKYVNMQCKMLGLIWPQRAISWNIFFNKVGALR